MLETQHVNGLEVFSSAPAGQPSQHPPLLFVHGAFAGGWMWTDTFMPFFSEAGYTCHALSLRGHGGSDGREHIDWHSVADYVEDIERVVDWIGEPPILIGHSMGGFIVQKYLEKHGDVPGAVLLCSVPPQGLIAAQFHLMFRKPQLFMDINRIVGGDMTDIDTLREALFAGDIDEKMSAAWLTRMRPESHRAIWDMSMFSLPRLDLMHRPPMLIAGAEHDVLVPAFLVQTTAQTYGLKDHIFPGVGHAVTHEPSWPDIAAWLRNWLDGIKP
jgi:non-heme chloroperoxidase